MSAKILQDKLSWSRPFYWMMRELFLMVGENINEWDLAAPEWWKKRSWSTSDKEEYLDRVQAFLMDNKDARERLMTVPLASPKLCRSVGENIIKFWGWNIDDTLTSLRSKHTPVGVRTVAETDADDDEDLD